MLLVSVSLTWWGCLETAWVKWEAWLEAVGHTLLLSSNSVPSLNQVCCDQQKVLPAESRDGLRVELGCEAVLTGGRS